MSSVAVLAVILVAAFIMLCYLFNESRIEADSVTIAAVEARAKKAEPKRKTAPLEDEERPEPVRERQKAAQPDAEPAPPQPAAAYEYRELLQENGDNYVIPQWMVNYFSSSDICHTLDVTDKVLFIVKLSEPNCAERSGIDISAECDMSTQTVSLKLCFGEGAAGEAVRTKFYLFERGDLFELNRLVRQQDVRVDVLSRAADFTLDYVKTLHTRLPQAVAAQLKNVLSKVPT